MVKRTAALLAFGFLTGAALAAFLTFPRGWNLLMGAAAATFAGISLSIGWTYEPEPDGTSGNQERSQG